MQYVVEMSWIGYGCTKQKVQDMVQAIIEKDDRPNPFTSNQPGEKWWELMKGFAGERFRYSPMANELHPKCVLWAFS